MITSVLIFAGIFIGLSACGVVAYFQWVRSEPGIKAGAGLAFFTTMFAVFSWYLVVKNFRELFVCRIVPYFESHVATYPDNQPDAFNSGIHLANHCRELDAIAHTAGVRPLSDFGFKDDYDGQRLVWHESSEGLATVTALMQHLAEGRQSPECLADLARLRDYLLKARAKGVRFCLIIRAGLDKFISPVEMDNRKGRFW